MKNKRIVYSAVLLAFAGLTIVLSVICGVLYHKERKIIKLMERGAWLYENQEYEAAAAAYKEVVRKDKYRITAYEGLFLSMHEAGDDEFASSVDAFYEMIEEVEAKDGLNREERKVLEYTLETIEELLPAPASTVEPPNEPVSTPTIESTKEPMPTPTIEPTKAPTPTPTIEPTKEPTPTPTIEPTKEPTPTPTIEPTKEPTLTPTIEPTSTPANDDSLTHDE